MAAYCTTQQVVDFLNWGFEIPEFIVNATPAFETVDDSGTLVAGSLIYLDHNRVIANTLILSFGATAASTTALVETTDFTIDLDKAKITITAAGAIAIGANDVFAEEYVYVRIDNKPGIKDSYISDLIDRATEHFDQFMNRSFQPTTLVTREIRTGKGKYARRYDPRNLPLIVVKMILTTTVDNVDTAFVVDTTTGLATGDLITAGTEIMSIDSVDSTTTLTITRGALSSTAAAHTSGDQMVNAALEVSTTPLGSVPAFTTLSYPGDFAVDSNTSLFTLLHNDITQEGVFIGQFPEKSVPDRVRLTYNHGTTSIPEDIRHACVTQVSNWLGSASIGKGIAEGQDGFTPRANEVLNEDIKKLLREHRYLLVDGS